MSYHLDIRNVQHNAQQEVVLFSLLFLLPHLHYIPQFYSPYVSDQHSFNCDTHVRLNNSFFLINLKQNFVGSFNLSLTKFIQFSIYVIHK